MLADQRSTTRLLLYWERLKGAGPYPDIVKFAPGAVEDIWPQCVRIHVNTRSRIPTYTYEYMGETIAAAYGRDLTGYTLDYRAKQFPGAVILQQINNVVNEGTPREDAGNFVNEAGQMIRYRACFLPFGNERKGLTHVIAGLSYRMF